MKRPKPAPADATARVDAFVEGLFTNGFGDRADRLVLVDEAKRDLGGWCRGAVRDRAFELVRILKEDAKRLVAKRDQELALALDLLRDAEAIVEPKCARPVKRGEPVRVARPFRSPADCARAIRNLLAAIQKARLEERGIEPDQDVDAAIRKETP